MELVIKKICYIDLDDTLADFETSFRYKLTRNPAIKFPQSQLKFFENLDPISGAIEAYHELKKQYHVKILTAPSVHNPLCYMEKRLWVEKHLGFDECENLIIAKDKTLLRGAYLIDDWPQRGLVVPEWEHLMFGSPQFPNWSSILKYLMK